MTRYVVLRHDTPPGSPRPLHWDLLLTDGPHLRAWALAEEPQAGRPIAAVLLPNHRLAYLDYEGPVSGGRGDVSRWDAGTFQWRQDAEHTVVVELAGQRLAGIATLTCAPADREHWQFLLR
jgi:hypothetical protein